MRNIVLTLEYDGSLFHGWQSQLNAATVQDAVAAAVGKLDGTPRRVTGASRTDAGVHAKAQVANFFTDSNIPADKYAYALNTILPAGVACVRSFEADSGFHARFSAINKAYSYLILNRRLPSALYRYRAWHVPLPLDITAMREAARLFIGEHDFKAFMSTGSPVNSTVRTITRLELGAYPASVYDPLSAVSPLNLLSAASPPPATCSAEPLSAASPPPASLQEPEAFIILLIEGNGFLYNMVRIITGTLVYVGQGRLSIGDAGRALASGDRKSAGKTAPPHGLYLEYVNYV